MDITFGSHKGKALSFTPRFSDLDRDGQTDIAVVADGRTTRMFWNDGAVFLNRTGAAGVASANNDMGFTLADFNGDGLLDWFVTAITQPFPGLEGAPNGNRLFLNNGNRTFTDITDVAGVRTGGWGWGAEALDFDNDGDLDVAHTNGMGVAARDQTIFFKNVGTRTNPQFVNAATDLGVTDDQLGRGLLTFDYDRDGDLDMFIVNFNSAPILYRNDGGNAKTWIEITTVGAQSNRDGVGAYITLTPDLTHPEIAYVREVTASSTYLAQSEMTAHFGLADVESIDRIEILWPSGYRQEFNDVAVNQRITITEGLLADFNGDDDVSTADLSTWQNNFGLVEGGQRSLGDANENGNVDGGDFLLWQRQAGSSVTSGISTEAAVAAPEPPCVLLAVAGVGAASGRRFRRTRRPLFGFAP
jgi:hypothetical protein